MPAVNDTVPSVQRWHRAKVKHKRCVRPNVRGRGGTVAMAFSIAGATKELDAELPRPRPAHAWPGVL